MESTPDHLLRQMLVRHLKGGEAFMSLEKLIDKMPWKKAGIVPEGLPYSFWQQLFHVRFAQLDILNFSHNPAYSEPSWPQDYWPQERAPKDEQEWKDLIANYFNERNQLITLITDPEISLFETFPHGSGQTLFREVLLVIEHTAYHTGQMLLITRLLKLYP